MKKYFYIIVILVGISTFGSVSHASTLNCYDVDGMAIFGYDWSEWKHIGAIGNEFNSLSIANEFGAGNEFKSTSIFNEFGKFGGSFSSYSAFNDFATKPPIIINDDYKFVGYMTLNTLKSPFINTYEAIACAKNSFRSPKRDLKDVTFKDIPSSASYDTSWSTYTDTTKYSPSNTELSCPAHSSKSLTDYTKCNCDTGYEVNMEKTKCVKISAKKNDKICRADFGKNSKWSKEYTDDGLPLCGCKDKYIWNSKKTSCIKQTK